MSKRCSSAVFGSCSSSSAAALWPKSSIECHHFQPAIQYWVWVSVSFFGVGVEQTQLITQQLSSSGVGKTYRNEAGQEWQGSVLCCWLFSLSVCLQLVSLLVGLFVSLEENDIASQLDSDNSDNEFASSACSESGSSTDRLHDAQQGLVCFLNAR